MSKLHRFFPITSCVVLALVAWTGGFSADPAPAGYRIEDLGTLGGPEACETGVFPTRSQANGINELGYVVGWAESSEHRLDPDTGEPLYFPDTGEAVCALSMGAALWRNGEIIEIVPFPGGSGPVANAVNDHDAVVGDLYVQEAPYHPSLWTEADGMIDLLEGWDVYGTSWGINNFGEITIMAAQDAYFRDVDGNLHQIRFPDTPDWGEARVYEINDDGIAVGAARRESGDDFFHAFRYDSKSDTIEDLHDPFYIWSFGYGINEHGDAAVEMTAYTWHVFSTVVANDGELVVLPLGNMRVDGELRPDLLNGGAADINAHGDVVGSDVSVAHLGAESWIAFDVFGDDEIEKIPLEDLLSPEDRAEWDISWAWTINDSRQIAGRGAHNGVSRAFLMTPDETVRERYDPPYEPPKVATDVDRGDRTSREALAGIGGPTSSGGGLRLIPAALARDRKLGADIPRPAIDPPESGNRVLERRTMPTTKDGSYRIPTGTSVPVSANPTSGSSLEPADTGGAESSSPPDPISDPDLTPEPESEPEPVDRPRTRDVKRRDEISRPVSGARKGEVR